MMSISKGIRRELEDVSSQNELQLIIDAYNNDSQKRVRNRMPRTDLMVKGLEAHNRYKNNGLIAYVAFHVLKERGFNAPDFVSFEGKLRYERYVDIGVLCGDWWQGESYWELIVEIENNWKELKGTLNDLFHCQSKLKWLILFSESPNSIKDELISSINNGYSYFLNNGFEENPMTKYEILVLPERLSKNGLKGEKVLEISFFRKDCPSLSKPKVTIL